MENWSLYLARLLDSRLSREKNSPLSRKKVSANHACAVQMSRKRVCFLLGQNWKRDLLLVHIAAWPVVASRTEKDKEYKLLHVVWQIRFIIISLMIFFEELEGQPKADFKLSPLALLQAGWLLCPRTRKWKLKGIFGWVVPVDRGGGLKR